MEAKCETKSLLAPQLHMDQYFNLCTISRTQQHKTNTICSANVKHMSKGVEEPTKLDHDNNTWLFSIQDFWGSRYNKNYPQLLFRGQKTFTGKACKKFK